MAMNWHADASVLKNYLLPYVQVNCTKMKRRFHFWEAAFSDVVITSL